MKSLGTLTRVCPNCGVTFTCPASKPRVYHSQKCKYDARVKRTEHPCPTCGNPVIETGRIKRTHCSPECGNSTKKKPVDLICVQCGNAFTRCPTRVSPYCSDECYQKHRHPRLEVRFWTHVDKTDGCWNWTGWKHVHGYGQITVRVEGKRVHLQAHRVAYTLTYGDIPDGLSVCHHCDNPACVRPDHLFIGTTADNMRDKTTKGRQRRGETSPGAKLDEDAVRFIRTNTAISCGTLATRYGVSSSLITAVRRRKLWAHVT